MSDFTFTFILYPRSWGQARGPILTREGKTTSNAFALEDTLAQDHDRVHHAYSTRVTIPPGYTRHRNYKIGRHLQPAFTEIKLSQLLFFFFLQLL